MYKIIKNDVTGQVNFVYREVDYTYIPLDPQNTDFLVFMEDVDKKNVELKNFDDVLMSQKEAREYIATL